jgi:hypothetical protein
MDLVISSHCVLSAMVASSCRTTSVASCWLLPLALSGRLPHPHLPHTPGQPSSVVMVCTCGH